VGLRTRGLIVTDKIQRILDDDKAKERERKERVQHPHMIESRKHWDWEQSYYEYYKDQGEEE